MGCGKLILPRLLIGRIIGRMVRPIYSNEKPFSKSSPTDPKFVISDQRDFQKEKEELKSKVREFQEGGEAKCTRHPHPFFGPLTPYEWGRGMYKHLDHHLRQFGA
jgi:transposase InsO family protein